MQNNETEQFIKNYVTAVDSQDVAKADSLLENNFRITMRNNREGEKISTLSKAEYLHLMRENKVGGLPRLVTIESLVFFGEFIVAAVVLENEKMKMESVYGILQTNGQYQLISDLLKITFK